MKPWRSRFAVAILSGSAIAGGFFGGNSLLERWQFARAEQQVEASREQLAHVEDLATVFRHIAKAVEPSVVKIEVKKTIKNPHGNMDPDLLRRFFQNRGGDVPNLPNMPDEGNGGDGGFVESGTGSGVIIDTDNDGYAYILTNNHVAGDASEITVTLNDGREIQKGKLLGADSKTDLAVVRIKADRVIAAKWGNSDELDQGDWVMAFGAPFGYVGSMTHGIVSAVNRHDIGIIDQGYENFIQVDAPINPGNSGGPLVNIHGEVVGVNTAIATRSGGFQGIGFAIPSNQAKSIYESLKTSGKVVRGWLGVEILDVAKEEPATLKNLGYDKPTGVEVRNVYRKTPATGRLQPSDIITKYNNQPVDNVQQLRNAVAATAPGTEVPVEVFRDGKLQDVTLKIGEQPDNLGAVAEGDQAQPEHVAPSGSLGMELQTLTEDLANQFDLGDVKSGAVITNVQRGSAAAKAGLQPGDVIVRVARTPVSSAKEAADAIHRLGQAPTIRLSVATKEGVRAVFLHPADGNGSKNQDNGTENP
jgi:serine protease Do